MDNRKISMTLAIHLFGWVWQHDSHRCDLRSPEGAEDVRRMMAANPKWRDDPTIDGYAEREFTDTSGVPDYLTGDGMLQVIEAMRRKGWLFELGDWPDGTTRYAVFRLPTVDAMHEDWAAAYSATAGTAQMAVALAACAALGVDVEGAGVE